MNNKIKELKEYRDLLIEQLVDDEFIENGSNKSYELNVQKLNDVLIDIKSHYKKIKQFQGDYRWLSNFYKCEIKYKDLIFPTNENFYQAMKTKDNSLRKEFTKMTPFEAKSKGKEIENSEKLRNDWNDIKLDVMLYGLKEKFKHKFLKERLINTGNIPIEEGNNWNDLVWGVDLKTGEGQNNLGKLLMKIRKELQNGK